MSGALSPPPRDTFHGLLIHYAKLDEELQFPPNTSRRLLIKVARKFGLEPQQATDNTVRFSYKVDLDSYHIK
jgi:hypothetical protein